MNTWQARNLKPGQRVRTPKGNGEFESIGKGKCIDIDVTGQLLIRLDKAQGVHWSFYFKKEEVVKLLRQPEC